MTRGARQKEFVFLIAQLIMWAYGRGYQLTFGDAYRDARAFGSEGESGPYGHPDSNHKKRLAIDLNLFVDGEYIGDGRHPAWVELADVWEYLAYDINGRSGIRFNDANHFEALEHQWLGERPPKPAALDV